MLLSHHSSKTLALTPSLSLSLSLSPTLHLHTVAHPLDAINGYSLSLMQTSLWKLFSALEKRYSDDKHYYFFTRKIFFKNGYLNDNLLLNKSTFTSLVVSILYNNTFCGA
jgi:hypothetical protein